jgi:hypothetical protein
VVEIGGDGHGGIATLGGRRKGVGGQGEVSFAVVEEKTELHLSAIGRVVITAGTDEQVREAVVVGIEEEDGFVLEVGEGCEGGLGEK